MDFFVKQHRQFPLLLHPLTASEVDDHTNAAAWIGNAGSVPLDLSTLHHDLGEPDICDTDWPQDIHPLVDGIKSYGDWMKKSKDSLWNT